jgi:hypothetical protein
MGNIGSHLETLPRQALNIKRPPKFPVWVRSQGSTPKRGQTATPFAGE